MLSEEKKPVNLGYPVVLHSFVYNFIPRHMMIRMPPALRAYVTDPAWTFEEQVNLIDRAEAGQRR
jgi:hypothetical protein